MDPQNFENERIGNHNGFLLSRLLLPTMVTAQCKINDRTRSNLTKLLKNLPEFDMSAAGI